MSIFFLQLLFEVLPTRIRRGLVTVERVLLDDSISRDPRADGTGPTYSSWTQARSVRRLRQAWFDLMLGFWLLFFSVVLILPRKWSGAVIEVDVPVLSANGLSKVIQWLRSQFMAAMP